MNMVWDRHISNVIRELVYDGTTQTMAVRFADRTTRYHAPVPYPLYAQIFHATFPERLYDDAVNGKIPTVDMS